MKMQTKIKCQKVFILYENSGSVEFLTFKCNESENSELVRPKLEYAAPIWHPYHETQVGQVEKVQRTAARWTCRR